MKFNGKQKLIISVLSGSIFALGVLMMDYFIFDDLKSSGIYVFQGAFFGMFMGLGFPFLFQKFGNKLITKLGNDIAPELSSSEQIEMEGPANLFRGMEGVGGKLFLTNEQVIFKAHRLNIQRGQTNIPYGNIAEFKPRKTAKLIDNGLRIETKDGKSHDFVVNSREDWLEKLKVKAKGL